MTKCGTTRKLAYSHPEDATRHADRLRRASPQLAAKINIYVCPHCNLWHVTSGRKR